MAYGQSAGSAGRMVRVGNCFSKSLQQKVFVMATQWGAEACHRRKDPSSGAWIIQLTGAAAISNNIYCEQPYCSPDGHRLIVARCQDFTWDTHGSLLVHDLRTLHTAMVVPRAIGVRNVFTSAWSGQMCYWTPDRKLMRLSLMTLESEEVYREEDPDAQLGGGGGACSMSPDLRYVIFQGRRMTGKDSPTFQIVRIDLKHAKREVIYEDPQISNAHLQFNPVHGKQLLVQNNVGTTMAADGSFVHDKTNADVKLFTLNLDGSNKQYLPVGKPVTAGCTGHECFVADTGKVMWSVRWDLQGEQMVHDKRFPEGNIMTGRPGEDQPTVFKAPEHFFTHVCASKCGKYFVADSFEGGRMLDENMQLKSVSLVIGNFETGKYRTLVQQSMASGGGNQSTHSHPYFTADNRHIIFNADPYYSIPQVYAAQLPDDFLNSLD